MKEISVQELKQMMDRKDDFQLIDVREMNEYEYCRIEGSRHIPIGEVLSRVDELNHHMDVIFHCKTGGRSGAMVNALMARGYKNVVNLKGGIMAWSEEIDPTVPTY